MEQRLIDACAFKQRLQMDDRTKIDIYGNILTDANALNIAIEQSAVREESEA